MKTLLKRRLRVRLAQRLAGYRDGFAARAAASLDDAYQAGWRHGRSERERQLRPRGAR